VAQLQEKDGFGRLLGSSPAMLQVFSMVEKAAQIDVPVLIEGETGTGKELAAREIHEQSARCPKPFVAVNTGVLSRELIVSELFGHLKGAFTGATENKKGCFDEADGGTLFLDEIATMDERVQVAFLRVLEEGVFRPLGAPTDKQANVRIIAATNMNLRLAVANGAFREDLLQRLTVFRIVLPPLRERSEDLPVLARHFLDSYRDEFELQVTGFDDEAMELLQRYAWPGNIRELKNAIAQAAIMAGQGFVRAIHIPPRISSLHPVEAAQEIGNEEHPDSGTEILAAPCSPTDITEETTAGTVDIPLGLTLDEACQKYILATLNYADTNKSKAAKLLGMSRKTLHEKLRRWDSSKNQP